jgi:rubredoxin
METDWYVYRDQQRWGPFSWEQMLEMAQHGNIKPNDKLWHPHQYPNFVIASKLQGLFVASNPDVSAIPSVRQCPNCGGFKTFRPKEVWEEENKPAGYGGSVLGIIFVVLIAFIFPVGTIIAFFMLNNILKRDTKKPAPSPYLYTCQLCGFRWEQKPEEVLPISVRPEFIQQGEQRLREEDEKRRQQQAQAQRDAEGAFWLSQQNKN